MSKKSKSSFPRKRAHSIQAAAPVHELLGQAVAMHQQGQITQAERLYEHVLRIQPQNFKALHFLGVIAYQNKKLERAVELISQAIEINPEDPEAHNNLGFVLQALRQNEAAVESFERAVSLKPDYAEGYNNCAVSLVNLKQYNLALQCFERAVALKPDYAKAHFSLSCCYLLLGVFDKGWDEYEWRHKVKDLCLPERSFAQPRWSGAQPLHGKTILLYGEQGLGDTLQFCRYVKLVSEQGAQVVLEVDKPLMGLLNTLVGVSRLVVKGAMLPDFDYYSSLLSLPRAFKTQMSSVPASPSYLASDTEKVRFWRDRLGTKTRPRVGLVWSGSAGHKNDHNRSIALCELAPLLTLDCQFISLQQTVRESDGGFLQTRTDIVHLGGSLGDFTDTAALCELMDVVISVDTSVAHLAGALGKPVWVLLPFSPDWRWLVDRRDSPWYPSARLYRQEQPGDWTGDITNVQADLAMLLKGQSGL
ncbi:MAG: tetratricopeptide repeat-containing glycosyltransferase family protein [Paralcaligenes sp.]